MRLIEWSAIGIVAGVLLVYFAEPETAAGALVLVLFCMAFSIAVSGIIRVVFSPLVKERSSDVETAMSQNNITLNFDNGSTFHGSLLVGKNIEASFNGAKEITDAEKRTGIENLVDTINTHLDAVESEEEKQKITASLEAFVNEAKKDAPNTSLLKVLSDSFFSGVKEVATFVTPVAKAVSAVLAVISKA